MSGHLSSSSSRTGMNESFFYTPGGQGLEEGLARQPFEANVREVLKATAEALKSLAKAEAEFAKT